MCLVERGSICPVSMTALGLGGYARTSHTPYPSREGRFGYLFLVGNEWFVVWGGFPSREGIKGCVTVRGADWDEMILLLFGEEVSVGFGRLLLV